MSKTSWRELIAVEMDKHHETMDDVVECTLSDDELDASFRDGYGGTEGAAFALWTHTRVYFPAQYDGAEWCASVARHPNSKATEHVGD